MISIVALLLAAASPGLVGRTYDEAVKGRQIDPVRRASKEAREIFDGTLNGPQIPGVAVTIAGHDLVVFEMCTAHFCAWNHSVVVIDRAGGSYAVTYGDDHGKVVVADNPLIERLLGSSCDANRCRFAGVPFE